MTRTSGEDRPTAVVLGASHWHAPLYGSGLARRFHVAAVQSVEPEYARSLADAVGVPVSLTVEDALRHDGIDVVFVFSPHHEMAAISLNLIDRRIPFVIEKPAGASLDELRDIEAAARRAGVPATVPLVQRNGPVETWLRQAGDIVYERMAFVAGPPSRYLRNGNPWMLEPTLSGGGSLMNLGPHFVDMAIRHLGLPAEVIRKQSAALHDAGVDDHATMILITATGREAIIEVGYAYPDSGLKRYCSFTAAGSNGFASVDTTGGASFTDNAGNTTSAVLEVDSDPLYEVFVDAVADSLGTGFAGMPTLAELVTAMEMIWSSDASEAVPHG